MATLVSDKGRGFAPMRLMAEVTGFTVNSSVAAHSPEAVQAAIW